jgi:hypothetical protein
VAIKEKQDGNKRRHPGSAKQAYFFLDDFFAAAAFFAGAFFLAGIDCHPQSMNCAFHGALL